MPALQSAILGMHSIVQRPMVVGGKVEPRPMMYVALTYDHRLVDGREVCVLCAQCFCDSVFFDNLLFCVQRGQVALNLFWSHVPVMCSVQCLQSYEELE